MARKKEYPDGFRLTLATARRLAVQEFGTAKGLEPDPGTCLEGFFTMQMCQRQFEIVRKRRRNFVVFRLGGKKAKRFLAQKECSRFDVSGA